MKLTTAELVDMPSTNSCCFGVKRLCVIRWFISLSSNNFSIVFENTEISEMSR